MKVSIVIPLYNKSDQILLTLNSVLNQTFKDFEVIIINDGSTDDGPSKLNFIDDHRIRVISKKNSGVSSTRNFGIKEAKGDFIYFLDADDIMKINCLEKLIETSERYPESPVIVSNFSILNDGKRVNVCSLSSHELISKPYKAIYYGGIFLRVGNVLINRNYLLDNNFYFDDRISFYEDFDFFLKIISTCQVGYTPEILFEYSIDNAELSITKVDRIKDYIYYLEFSGMGFYQKMICLNIVYASIMKRVYGNDLNEAFFFIRRYILIFPIVILNKIFSVVVRKIQGK
ncbi:glycosyltransferase family 2 protein [Vibrio vulnificus]|nr:glycosyltransferase family 2 protein [Vibrio vulnificus]